MSAQTVTVNINDWLSDADMRQIARDAFREAAVQKSHKDFERILSNAAYELVQREVDAVFDEGMAATVKEKAIKVISELGAFTVFKRPDVWDKTPSTGWGHLQSAVEESRPLISSRVAEIIQEMSHDDLHELIQAQVSCVLVDRLTRADA